MRGVVERICGVCYKDKILFKRHMVCIQCQLTCIGCGARKRSTRGSQCRRCGFSHTGYFSQDLGFRVRSSWEEFYLLILTGAKVPFQYEPRTFTLSRKVTYLPDIYLINPDIWVEIKGNETEEFMHKRKLFEKLGYRLVMVTDKSVESARELVRLGLSHD
jgi:hypothetical protein